MAKKYTLEDVETLRSKAGVSYEEAVELLDKYDGDTARALIELEKRGRLDAAAQNGKVNFEDIWARIKVLWNKGMTTRVHIERKGETLLNLSVLFLLLMLLLGSYAVLAAAVIALASGCTIRIQSAAKPEASCAAEEPSSTPSDDDDFPSITIS